MSMEILIADDSRSVRTMLSVLLRESGYTVHQTVDGEDAFTKMCEIKPPITILDWEMPRMSGIEVCKKIRKSDFSDAYIIMLTSKGDSNSIAEGLNAGADDYLVKPFNEIELKARIRSGERMRRGHEEKMRYYISMQQQHRMKSVGVLAAGIAHEINNPAQYIIANIGFVQECVDKVISVIDSIKKMADDMQHDNWSEEKFMQLVQRMEELEIDYELNESSQALNETMQGVKSISSTVSALKNFAVSATENKVPIDSNQTLQNTLHVSKHWWQSITKTELALEKNLPQVKGFAAELSQSFWAVFQNAVEAIQRKGWANCRGIIECRTFSKEKTIEVVISDNGVGMTSHVLEHAFDPFFSTKEEGEGQGQGLTFAYDAIVNKHRGSISIESKEHLGTIVRIVLPR